MKFHTFKNSLKKHQIMTTMSGAKKNEREKSPYFLTFTVFLTVSFRYVA